MLPTTTYSSPSSTPTPLLPPSEPLSEPSLPPSIPESRLKPTTSRCTGYFWNLACENTPSRAQGGCLPCNQGFSVNFNLLRIRDRVDHTSYKNFTYISSKELAIKFMTTEEAESQSEQDLKLKPYQSPYGRMGEEIFVYCGAKCNKITLKNPEPSLPKRRVGCCLWTLQRRGQGRPLLIKQSDERRSPPPPDEVMTNPFTTLPETAPPFSFSNRENTFSMTARVSNIFFSSHSSSSTNTSTLPASHTTPSPSLLPLFSATTQSDLFSYSEPVLATGGNPETSNLPNPLSSSSTSALTATTRNAFLDEPSSPHSKGAAKLDPKRICIGNFWNLDCKIIAKKPLRCGSCDQGFPVNFNLLRITDTLNHTQDKKITSISSTEFAIKFNTPEEAEAESQTNPNLKAYQSPYGRTGEEIFVFCASACRKIVLKNPDRFIHKHKAGCCLWTMQKRGQKLLIKQSNQKPAPPSSVEVEANSSTARPEVPPLFSFSHTEDALSRTAKASNHIFSLSSLSLENTSTPPPSQTPSTPSLFPLSSPTIHSGLSSSSVRTSATEGTGGTSNLSVTLHSSPKTPLPTALSPHKPSTPPSSLPASLKMPLIVADIEDFEDLEGFSFTATSSLSSSSSSATEKTPKTYNLSNDLPSSSTNALISALEPNTLFFKNLKMTPLIHQAEFIDKHLTIHLHKPTLEPLPVLKDLKLEFCGVEMNFEINSWFIKIDIPRNYFSAHYLNFLRFRQIECEFPDTVVIRNAKKLETKYKIRMFLSDNNHPLFEKWLTLESHLLENFNALTQTSSEKKTE